jgi:hypothetical protein
MQMANQSATIAAQSPQEPRAYSYSKRVGSTEYRVNVFFGGENADSIEEKLLRCVRNDLHFDRNHVRTC